MADFKTSLNIVLSHEGGHNAAKPAVYRGIYSGSEPGRSWSGWSFFKGKKPKFNQVFNDPNIIKSVENFYFENYWKPYNLGSIENQKIANFLFDWLVNTNPIKVSKITNTLLGLKASTLITKKAIDLINSLPSDEILNKFISARVVFLSGLKLAKSVKDHLVKRAKSYF